MGRNHPAEEDSLSPDLPPDRIHYLLPEGCSEITDKWELEKQKAIPPPPPERRVIALSLLKESALSLFEAAEKQASGPTPNESLPKSLEPNKVILPESITVAALAQVLDMKVFQLIKAAIQLKLFLKADSVLPYTAAAAVCEVLGVEVRRADTSGEAEGA